MRSQKIITENKIWIFVALGLILLAFAGSDAQAKTFDADTETASPTSIDITQADVNLAKQKVLLGINTLDTYWQEIFTNSGYRYNSPQVYYYDEPVRTSCGTIPVSNAVYCPLNNSIYFDLLFFTRMMKAVGKQYGTDGDMAIITVLAHEWGHAVQSQTNNFWQLPLMNELGADCFAGAFVGNASRLGYIEKGDSEEALLTLAIGGDNAPWYAPQAHGSAKQRMKSFSNGFSNGLTPCVAG